MKPSDGTSTAEKLIRARFGKTRIRVGFDLYASATKNDFPLKLARFSTKQKPVVFACNGNAKYGGTESDAQKMENRR